ncbi:MAG: hypothetical protein ACRDS0_31990 [Pseudonocardiaceae bacterium]
MGSNGASETAADRDATRVDPRTDCAPTATTISATSADTSAAIARTTTDSWIAAHPGTTVLTVDQTDTTATVTGPTKPSTEDLQSQLRAALPRPPQKEMM